MLFCLGDVLVPNLKGLFMGSIMWDSLPIPLLLLLFLYFLLTTWYILFFVILTHVARQYVKPVYYFFINLTFHLHFRRAAFFSFTSNICCLCVIVH